MKIHAKRGRIFILSAPSGTGKTTLCNKLLKERLGLARSISVTTRAPRSGEKDGVDYHFITRRHFKSMIARDAFLEYEENFGNFYGTPRRAVELALEEGKNVVLTIDVKGAMKVRRIYPEETVLVFILPPSIRALKERLHFRKSDSAHTIRKRLQLAKQEISYKDRYDYRVVNDKLYDAHKKLKKIILSETTVNEE